MPPIRPRPSATRRNPVPPPADPEPADVRALTRKLDTAAHTAFLAFMPRPLDRACRNTSAAAVRPLGVGTRRIALARLKGKSPDEIVGALAQEIHAVLKAAA